jgi:hypothetical protein
VLLVAALPLGWVGSRLEWFQRSLQDVTYNTLIISARRGSGYASWNMVRRSLLQSMAFSFLLFLVVQSVLFFIFQHVFSSLGETVRVVPLHWTHLWVVATIGPLLSLRHRVPYFYLLAALGAAAAALWLLAMWPAEIPLS